MPSTTSTQKVKLPTGYTLEWAGEYASQQRANARLALIVPITVLLIVLLLYTAFGSFNWSLLIMATLATAPIGGMLALLATGTHFSVSSGIGMLALFGVSVQVGLDHDSVYQSGARWREPDILKAIVEGAVRSLRPTLMVMLVATLGFSRPRSPTTSARIRSGPLPSSLWEASPPTFS